MATRKGKATLLMQQAPSVLAAAAVGGKKESQGPLASNFDYTNNDSTFGQKSWEAAESDMQKRALQLALEKGKRNAADLDYIFAGDLLNQCTGSTFGLREMGVPFLGLYGACSTMAESLGLAALFVEGGFAQYAAAVTSSHFCSAERQFRFPLEYGGQRPPSAQWTATAAGAAVVGRGEKGPFIRGVTFGRIVDLGIKDANNMGAAMAPAAADTLCRFFADMGTGPQDYDLIVTGDLGQIGSRLLYDLMKREGYQLEGHHKDCGLMLYDLENFPQAGAGGSGCGCSASVLCGHLLKQVAGGGLKNLLFMATGALMSPTSSQQGESIPGVAHLIWISAQGPKEAK
ncbi:MAG: stage V sporulation protein AD [Oscillospiraceae bacterium]|nr:stage V sporulation protein AD [Oscillospiraceae bacterium]